MKELLRKYNIRPSRSRGQNFLVNKGIAEKIINAAELSREDTVLEIGPGLGILTERLIRYAGRVIAVEKDKRLYDFLSEKLKDIRNLELINADILYLQPTTYNLQLGYKIVANIPYNITGQFFKKFLSADNRPETVVVMVQKEVGERLLGKKDRSLLTLAAELYGRAEKVCDVSPGSFEPSPAVSSMVVRLAIGRREPLEQKIFHFAKIGFSSRRKKLISNLSTGLKKDKKYLKDAFDRLGLNHNVRAEELSKTDWLKLAESL
jgi:16S rRNA (adenine1518-N6/adenine1519-N6)-dimethyltransferase